MKNIFRRITTLFFVIVLIFIETFGINVNAVSADSVLTDRSDFLWGVNTKNSSWIAYPKTSLEDQFHHMAELGVKIVRAQTSGALEEMDATMALAQAYGIKVMLCIGRARLSDEEYNAEYQYEMAKMYANRYNGKNGYGKVDYFCIDNELDVYLGVIGDNVGVSIGDGTNMNQYVESEVRRVCYQLNNAIAGVRAADTDAKIVINSTWTHYGFHDWLKECNVDYDIYGLDWYTDMARYYKNLNKKPLEFADFIYERFGKPVMICESNEWSSSLMDEEDPSNWDTLVETMEDAYTKSHVIGYILYELYDNQNGKSDADSPGGFSRENHFGLMYTDGSTVIGPKAIYKRLQNIWGGKAVTKIKLDDIMNSQINSGSGSESAISNNISNNNSSIDYSNIANVDSIYNYDDTDTDDYTVDGDSFSEESNDDKTNISDTAISKKHPSKSKLVWTGWDTATVIIGAVCFLIVAFSAVFMILRAKQIKRLI